MPNFLAGDAEARFTRNLPRSDIGGGQRALGSFPTVVCWLLSTYAEPHALGLAQEKFSWATLVDNEGVDAFATRLRSLAELCGNIHSEGTMKQQLIQGLPEYLRTDAFVYNTAQQSYQQFSTYVAGKSPVLTVGMDPPSKTDEEAETSRRAEEGIDEGQLPPHPLNKTYSKPEVHWERVPDAFRGDVDDLLEEYRTLWAGQLGKVDVTPHRIEVTSEARPRRAQPYWASHASREVIAKEVQRQWDLGYIEPSSAEWAFPVVLVPKPDRTMRFCVDHRQLNEGTVRDVYPLPRMDECIDFLGDAKVFSTLDCNSG